MNIYIFSTKEIPFPFRGKVRMGVGSPPTIDPTPIPAFPLKGKEFHWQGSFFEYELG